MVAGIGGAVALGIGNTGGGWPWYTVAVVGALVVPLELLISTGATLRRLAKVLGERA